MRDLISDGFSVVPRVIDPATIVFLREEFERLAPDFASHRNGAAFGMRGVSGKSELVREISLSETLKNHVISAIGAKARPVRTIFFDKTSAANWPLPWHQDRVIALAERHNIIGYNKWTLKNDVTHVEPPLTILQQIATVRIHLDDCDENNGALQVVAGWHDRLYPSKTLATLRGSDQVETLCANAGDAILMRPLTPHSSDKTISDRRRRVLHIEYCSAELPAPLTWREII